MGSPPRCCSTELQRDEFTAFRSKPFWIIQRGILVFVSARDEREYFFIASVKIADLIIIIIYIIVAKNIEKCVFPSGEIGML